MKTIKYNTMNYKKVVMLLGVVGISFSAVAQNIEGVSIAPDVTPPHESAMLDVVSANKGVSIPNVNLKLQTLDNDDNGTKVILDPKDGLLIYNKNTGTDAAPQGIYRWDGARWRHVGHNDIPKMEYADMVAMLPYLTIEDRGMLVYSTTTESGVYPIRTWGCISFPVYSVLGMWYLTSTYCSSDGTHYLSFIRTDNTYGKNIIGSVPDASGQGCGVVCQSDTQNVPE